MGHRSFRELRVYRPGKSTGQGSLPAREVYRPRKSTGQGSLPAKEVYQLGNLPARKFSKKAPSKGFRKGTY